jgi:acyl-coenzyme A thioesterase PaaI-like protein
MDVADTLAMLNPRSISTAKRNVFRDLWDFVSPLPAGKHIFSKAIGAAAPYTGSIGARVDVLRPGYAEIWLNDKPSIRNHLSSIHAAALANLAELTASAALAYTLPDDARFIPAGLSIDYLKKARGTIRGLAECPLITTSEKREYSIPVSIRDAEGYVVATATLRVLVGPKRGT